MQGIHLLMFSFFYVCKYIHMYMYIITVIRYLHLAYRNKHSYSFSVCVCVFFSKLSAFFIKQKMSAFKHSLKAFPILLDTSKFHIIMLNAIHHSWLSLCGFKAVREYTGVYTTEKMIFKLQTFHILSHMSIWQFWLHPKN